MFWFYLGSFFANIVVGGASIPQILIIVVIVVIVIVRVRVGVAVIPSRPTSMHPCKNIFKGP
jgi:hypothetical protein